MGTAPPMSTPPLSLGGQRGLGLQPPLGMGNVGAPVGAVAAGGGGPNGGPGTLGSGGGSGAAGGVARAGAMSLSTGPPPGMGQPLPLRLPGAPPNPYGPSAAGLPSDFLSLYPKGAPPNRGGCPCPRAC
jgi:hypothetical protein